MDKRPRDLPSFITVQAVGWLGLYVLVLVAVLPYLNEHQGIIAANTVMIGAWLLASCGLRYFCRAVRRHRLGWARLVLMTGVASGIAATLSTALAFVVIAHVPSIGIEDWSDYLKSVVQAWVLLLFWCTLYFGILQWHDAGQERERRLIAEAAARQARLDALRYQLNPHFLFNALNAVTTLVLEGNTTTATRMLTQIAGLLRTSLDESLVEVPLADELAFTERYLAIEQVRLEDRLEVALEIQRETRQALVPSLLLQPLVENAVRHGVASLVDGGRIAIASELIDQRLRISVRNSGLRHGPIGPSPRRRPGGIGLANTVERLRTLYGDDHRLTLRWPEAGGCEVLMDLPFRTKASVEGTPACVH
jgi:two-component system, LytTR family, sensor kinase